MLLSLFRRGRSALLEVINGTSLQFYLSIRKKLDIKPLWIPKRMEETLMVVKFELKVERLTAKEGRENTS